jgi:ribosome-associated protein
MSHTEDVEVGAAGIRLGQLLKYVNAVETGGEVKDLLASGEVRVNGEVDTRRGAQLSPGDVVTVPGATYRLT